VKEEEKLEEEEEEEEKEEEEVEEEGEEKAHAMVGGGRTRGFSCIFYWKFKNNQTAVDTVDIS
jgi:hypothetical protein